MGERSLDEVRKALGGVVDLSGRRMHIERATKLVTDALAIEHEEAKKAGALGFMARVLVQATLPHSRPEGDKFTRTNGHFTLSILSSSGLPYGSMPRLLLTWLTTEAVRKKSPVIELGDSVVQFLRQIGISSATGGRTGSITRARNQMIRLFGSTISCTALTADAATLHNVSIAEEARLWWNPQRPDQLALFKSVVRLSPGFFQQLVERPIPVDLRALSALRQSPLALDIYCWLTYRMSYLRRPIDIPWGALQLQFGCDYGRPRAFKEKFQKRLKEVLQVYRHARAEGTPDGLRLAPSAPHVARKLLAP